MTLIRDRGADCSIPGGFRRFPGDAAHGDCVGHSGARFHLGDLGKPWHVPRLAERSDRVVRRGLEHVAREHRAHGAGILSAVGPSVAVALIRGHPDFHNNGKARYLGEKLMLQKSMIRAAIGVGVLAMSAVQSVWAALPTPVAPSTAPAAGDWIGLIKGYIKDGGLVLGLAIAVIGFLWVAYLGFAKFNEARQGKAEWAEVGVLGIVGAVVLIFASFLLTEAAGVI